MLIDLHCHSSGLSACSALRAEEIIDLARERGLDAICLTEHDRHWGRDELTSLRARTAFPVFTGVELTVAEGHLLGFGMTDGLGASSLADAAGFARKQGGLIYVAHPARDQRFLVTPSTLEHCASVEALNGSDSRLVNAAGGGLASKFGLPGIAGSDCHSPAEVGTAATFFERPVRTDEELVRELAAGRYSAVYL